MPETVKVPSRSQLGRLVGNDQEMVRLLELLFRVAGNLTPAEIAAITTAIADLDIRVSANEADIATNAADIAINASDIGDNAVDIATNVSDIASNLAAINANSLDIGTNTLDIASLDSRVDAIELWDINDLNDVSAASPSAGMVLIYDATAGDWEAHTLTAGSNISITNADGSITIATSGASGSWTAGSGETITVSNGIVTSIV